MDGWMDIFASTLPLTSLCLRSTGEGGQGDAAGGGAAPEARQHEAAGGEPDGSGSAQEVHRVVLSQHRQEALRGEEPVGELRQKTEGLHLDTLPPSKHPAPSIRLQNDPQSNKLF